MISLLTNPAFRSMFLAQVFSLVGSGLATVALGLLAYQFAGDSAGIILGTALAIKMVAYVLIAPVAGALSTNFPRRRYLISLDIIRAALVLFFPFVDTVWQIYVLIFLLFTVTAGFSPVFHATIPDIVTEEKSYAKALSLSRLAFNIESIISPILAGVLMNFISFHWLFTLTSVGFLISAGLVGTTKLPIRKIVSGASPFFRRVTSGINIFYRTPRLRGLFTLNLALSLVGANIFVNSIIIAHQTLLSDEKTYLNLLLAFGIGSIIGALAMPFLFKHVRIRTLCVTAAIIFSIAPFSLLVFAELSSFLVVWALIGAGMSIITTSSGLLLRSSSFETDRPSVFAAQFSLSHLCWLIGYPLAAWLGVQVGPVMAIVLMAGAAIIAIMATLVLWPSHDPSSLYHEHSAYTHEHAHIHDDDHHNVEHEAVEGGDPHSHEHHHPSQGHTHIFVIDEHHLHWPSGDHHLAN
jgi:MFS family permease